MTVPCIEYWPSVEPKSEPASKVLIIMLQFHIWSDNAGCFRSTEMMSFLFQTGCVISYDFCEAQNGKGPYDRTAATIKSAIRRYVNQGHDVVTAYAMKEVGLLV